MFAFLSNFFQAKGIDLFAPIRLSDCRIQKPYLLERAGITDGTVILLVVPYFTEACTDPARNLSVYAVSRDYHRFFSSLFEELLPLLREAFPSERFAAFVDHSPILEVEAAAKAGLGCIGKNHMLITKKYSSYVFLGELITSAHLETEIHPVECCEDCGLCQMKCPMVDAIGCLSALTQKKGALTAEEERAILSLGSVWGCDVCQSVCPHTKAAIESGSILSPIPFFSEHTLSHLTLAGLDAMDDTAFAERAYAWRGRETIRRNLILSEEHKRKEFELC